MGASRTCPTPCSAWSFPPTTRYGRSWRPSPTCRSNLERRSLAYEIIVAADGTDGTREKVAELAKTDARLSVLGSPSEGGRGGVRLAAARARGDIVGFTDADGKTPAAEMDRLLPWLNEGYDLVIGSRACPAPAWR